MKYDPEKHHRRSIRLKGYDYSQPGDYFVTMVTQGRECLFGDVVGGKMRLNEAGRMVQRWWSELNWKFPYVHTDLLMVMPNHVHGIITLVGADLGVCPDSSCPDYQGAHAGVPLPKIVQWFKTMTTNEYIHRAKEEGWLPFRDWLWQRNYYEHIIRNEESLNRIREYITNNPLQWEMDLENPLATRLAVPKKDEPWRV